MGTALTTRLGNAEALQKYANALGGVAASVGSDNDRDILNLDKDDGFWFFGQERTELSVKDVLAVNPLSFRHGYIAFGNNDIAETVDGNAAEMLFPITQPLPYVDELPELEEVKGKRGEKPRVPSWQIQIAADMVVADGPNKGAEVVYKPTSRGGLRMMRKLSEEIARRIAAGNEECVPIIELSADSYQNKRYGGRVYTPEFFVVEWLTLEDETFKSPEPAAKKGGKADAKEDKRRGRDADDEKPARARRGRDAYEPSPRDKEKEARRNRAEPAEEDERPRRRGRDEEDEKPVRARRDEDEKPARGRDRDEDERPRRRGRDEEVEAEEPRRGRSRDTDDRDEKAKDDKPVRGRRDRDEPEDEGVRGRRAAAGARRR